VRSRYRRPRWTAILRGFGACLPSGDCRRGRTEAERCACHYAPLWRLAAWAQRCRRVKRITRKTRRAHLYGVSAACTKRRRRRDHPKLPLSRSAKSHNKSWRDARRTCLTTEFLANLGLKPLIWLTRREVGNVRDVGQVVQHAWGLIICFH
jgi:hypothetical protein